jgi:hypothetical protein
MTELASAPRLIGLAAVVLGAFVVEAALGFGATVVTVALGSLLLPTGELLAAFVPLNVALSAYLTARHARAVAWRSLLLRVVPFFALGLPAGVLIFRTLGTAGLARAFGGFVVALALIELATSLRAGAAPARPLPAAARAALLAVAGVIHGVFATGGPLVVFVMRREEPDSGRFRATLSALWLGMNAVLLVSYASSGVLTRASLATTAALAPALLLGAALGERLHHRLAGPAFHRLVLGVLLAAGAVLVAR